MTGTKKTTWLTMWPTVSVRRNSVSRGSRCQQVLPYASSVGTRFLLQNVLNTKSDEFWSSWVSKYACIIMVVRCYSKMVKCLNIRKGIKLLVNDNGFRAFHKEWRTAQYCFSYKYLLKLQVGSQLTTIYFATIQIYDHAE